VRCLEIADIFGDDVATYTPGKVLDEKEGVQFARSLATEPRHDQIVIPSSHPLQSALNDPLSFTVLVFDECVTSKLDVAMPGAVAAHVMRGRAIQPSLQ
jgi:hypothetical protein